jgi:hypothetical protein
MRFHVHHHSDPAFERKLGRIEEALEIIIERLNRMALDFARIETEVSEIGTVVDSAVTLLQAVAQDIRDNVANQAKLNQLADNLDAKAAVLGQAIEANQTPAPTPPAA